MCETSRVTDSPPPYGEIIERAREARGLSVRKAAAMAGVSDTWWRNVARGYELRRGVRVPIDASPNAIARMADVARLRPEDLEEAHPQAAAELQAMRGAQDRLRDDGAAGHQPDMTGGLTDPAEKQIADMDTLSVGERIGLIVQLRIGRINAERAAETDALRDEVERLRNEVEQLRGRVNAS